MNYPKLDTYKLRIKCNHSIRLSCNNIVLLYYPITPFEDFNWNLLPNGVSHPNPTYLKSMKHPYFSNYPLIRIGNSLKIPIK